MADIFAGFVLSRFAEITIRGGEGRSATPGAYTAVYERNPATGVAQ